MSHAHVHAVEHVIHLSSISPAVLAMSAPLDLLVETAVAQEAAVSLVSSLSGRPLDANPPGAGSPRAKRVKLDRQNVSDKSCSSSAESNPEMKEAVLHNGDSSAAQGDFSPTAVADSKRALRAERNRQSAAASRERKKRHLKDLENQVRYLGEMHTALQYRAHVDQQAWNEKEQQLENEIAKLNTLLASTHADNRELRNQLEAARESQP